MKNAMRAIHSGEILREEFLLPLKMSADALEAALGLRPDAIAAIVRQQSSVTPEIAELLARHFGTSPDFWAGLQLAYDQKCDTRN